MKRVYTLQEIKKFPLGVNNQGYVLRYLPSGEWRNKTCNWALEHRLKMEAKLGRLLTIDEHVHHKNNVKNDNRMCNLVMLTKSDHARLHNPLLGRFLKCRICGKRYYRTRSDINNGTGITCSRSCGRKTETSKEAVRNNLKPPPIKARCRLGHDLSGDNLRLLKRKSGIIERICRECVRVRNRKSKQKRRHERKIEHSNKG